MPAHRLHVDHAPAPPGGTLTLCGDEAWHAVAVKRCQPGEQVEILDGRGTLSTATVQAAEKSKREASLIVVVTSVRTVPPVTPRIDVWAALPKGDRASWMIDQLAQSGAASFAPLHSERSISESGDHKLDRLRRIAAEASKQCGRAWHLDVGPARSPGDLLRWKNNHPSAVAFIADAGGTRATGHKTFTHALALIGPEGGFTPGERQAAIEAGAQPLYLGPHVLRTETAALAAAVALVNR